MTIRKLVNTLHLWLGIASGIILLIVATTGCVLAFEDEIRSATQHRLLYVEPVDKSQLSVENVLTSLKDFDPKLKVNQLRFYGDADRAVQCYTKDKRIYAVNPYTGEVLGFRDQEKDFLAVVLSLHRTLLLGHTGEVIISLNVWIFLIMLLTGLVLWAPQRIRQLRQTLTIKRGVSAKRRNYDLHSVLGFYAFLPLLFIAITGISMASGGERAKPKKSKPQPGIAAGAGVYDQALQQVYHREPIEFLRINLPKDSTDIISIGIRYQTSGLRKQTNFSFDRYTARLLSTEPWEEKSFGQRFFGSNYEIHTGRIWGLPGKLIMFLAAVVAISLPITGFLIWRGKRRKVSVKRDRL